MADQPAPRPAPNWASDFPKLREATDKWLFGDIWERSGLSKRDRSLITVAMLIALYRHEQLPGHVNRTLDNGVTKEELVEVITHATFYSGWPTGVQSAAIAKKLFESDARHAARAAGQRGVRGDVRDALAHQPQAPPVPEGFQIFLASTYRHGVTLRSIRPRVIPARSYYVTPCLAAAPA